MPRDPDTAIGGGARRFPATRPSLIERARSADDVERRAAYESLIAAYWKPSYAYARLTWGLDNEDAKDLIQAFFTEAMAKDFFTPWDPSQARFRTWLRTCLHGFAAKDRRAALRLKRGGGAEHVELDASLGTDPALDARFRQEWVREVFAEALSRLERHATAAGREAAYRVFRSYDVDGAEATPRPTYAELAHATGLPVTQVTNYLAWARRELRTIVLAVLREGAATDAEYREDVRDLLGVAPP